MGWIIFAVVLVCIIGALSPLWGPWLMQSDNTDDYTEQR